jgi:hypothetical protein
MHPEPSTAFPNTPSPENTLPPSLTSQHGQRHDDDLQGSRQPHSRELRGTPEPSTGGNAADATRSNATSDDEQTVNTFGVRGTDASTPPPRDRISEYENARVKTPRKPLEGPLFEVIKSNRRPDDKSSPIAKLPNGECPASWNAFSLVSVPNAMLMSDNRGLDSCHCSPFAQRSRRRVPCVAPLQRLSHHTACVAGGLWALFSRSTGARRRRNSRGSREHRRCCAVGKKKIHTPHSTGVMEERVYSADEAFEVHGPWQTCPGLYYAIARRTGANCCAFP